MDEVFGARNFIADLTVEMNPKGRQLDKFFAGSNDRVLVYAKHRSRAVLATGTTDDVNHQDFPKVDENGLAFRYLPLRNTNKKFNPKTARTMYFAIHGNPNTGESRWSPSTGRSRYGRSSGTSHQRSGVGRPPRSPPKPTNSNAVSSVPSDASTSPNATTLGTDRTKKLKTVWLSRTSGPAMKANAS